MSTIMIIPDTHLPFMHQDAPAFLKAVKLRYAPNIFVHLGDLADQHHYSKYVNSTKGQGGREEILNAKQQLKALGRLFPKLHVCWGNHDLRIYQKAAQSGIDDSFLKDYLQILGAPKTWQIEDRWEFNNIIFEHGIGRSGLQGALKSAMANMQSTVIGHIHSHAGILYYGNKKSFIWGFNVGALIDDRKYAFEYGRFNTAKSVLGCGIIQGGLPIFIPMILNDKHRWVGKI